MDGASSQSSDNEQEFCPKCRKSCTSRYDCMECGLGLCIACFETHECTNDDDDDELSMNVLLAAESTAVEDLISFAPNESSSQLLSHLSSPSESSYEPVTAQRTEVNELFDDLPSYTPASASSQASRISDRQSSLQGTKPTAAEDQAIHCSLHEDCELKFFCCECEVAVCIQARLDVSNTHFNHTLDELERCAANAKKTIQVRSKKFSKTLKSDKEFVQYLERQKSNFQAQEKRAAYLIGQEEVRLVQKLTEIRKARERSNEDIARQFNAQINERIQRLQLEYNKKKQLFDSLQGPGGSKSVKEWVSLATELEQTRNATEEVPTFFPTLSLNLDVKLDDLKPDETVNSSKVQASKTPKKSKKLKPTSQAKDPKAKPNPLAKEAKAKPKESKAAQITSKETAKVDRNETGSVPTNVTGGASPMKLRLTRDGEYASGDPMPNETNLSISVEARDKRVNKTSRGNRANICIFRPHDYQLISGGSLTVLSASWTEKLLKYENYGCGTDHPGPVDHQPDGPRILDYYVISLSDAEYLRVDFGSLQKKRPQIYTRYFKPVDILITHMVNIENIAEIEHLRGNTPPRVQARIFTGDHTFPASERIYLADLREAFDPCSPPPFRSVRYIFQRFQLKNFVTFYKLKSA